ncbi:MAG: hypothetical protein R3B91_06670 [Planctomycetaceae bacterium]
MMHLLKQLWRDEAGYVLSAEAVTVGAVGVLGATVGLSAVSESVNKELTETAYAIRSLDQSYCVPAQKGCGAWTAGSCYTQPDVEQARADLGQYIQNLQGGPNDLPPGEEASPTGDEPEASRDDRPNRERMKDRARHSREEERRMRQRKREQRKLLKQKQESSLDEADTI